MKKIILSIIIIFLLLLLIIIFYISNRKNIGNEAAAINLYEELIDIIANKYSNTQDAYLSICLDDALDPLNKKELSGEAKETILNYSKKYNSTIYNKSKQSFVSLGDGNYESLKGLFINFSFSSFSYEAATINVFYYRGNQSSGKQTYLLKHTKGSWNISKINLDIIS